MAVDCHLKFRGGLTFYSDPEHKWDGKLTPERQWQGCASHATTGQLTVRYAGQLPQAPNVIGNIRLHCSG